MPQSDAQMIVHVHLSAAAVADKILIISLERTAEADDRPAGIRQAGGCRLVHEAVQAGRDHQKISRLCKC